METIPLEHGPLSLPLPVYTTVALADAVSQNGGRFLITAGLAKELVGQLRTCALDESDAVLKKYTSDHERFGEGSYEEWYGKSRMPFSLVDMTSGVLAAVCWFGPKRPGALSASDTKDWHTVAYRSYGAYRGKGLMKDFVGFAIDEYLKAFPAVKLWVVADPKNGASIALAGKLGFEASPELSDANGAVMVRK